MNAFEAAAPNGRAEDLEEELMELFTTQNRSQDPGATSIATTYLRVTVAVNDARNADY